MPNLAGKSQATARQLLADVGLNIGKIIKIDSRAQKAGRVISTNPAAFADAFRGRHCRSDRGEWVDRPARGRREDRGRGDESVARARPHRDANDGTEHRDRGDGDPAGSRAGQGRGTVDCRAGDRQAYPVTTTTTVTTTPSSSSSNSSTTTTTTSTSTATLTSPPRSPPGPGHAREPERWRGPPPAPVALGRRVPSASPSAGLWPVAGRRRRSPPPPLSACGARQGNPHVARPIAEARGDRGLAGNRG